MSATLAASADLVELARAKLATPLVRVAELDQLARVLHRGERVVTLCDALFRSGRQEWRGLTVLTDERLICLYTGSSGEALPEVRLSRVSSVEVGMAPGSGDAKRGELTVSVHGVETHVGRVRPWERAAEIADHIAAAISVRESA